MKEKMTERDYKKLLNAIKAFHHLANYYLDIGQFEDSQKMLNAVASLSRQAQNVYVVTDY
jgi:hypothetical protein